MPLLVRDYGNGGSRRTSSGGSGCFSFGTRSTAAADQSEASRHGSICTAYSWVSVYQCVGVTRVSASYIVGRTPATNLIILYTVESERLVMQPAGPVVPMAPAQSASHRKIIEALPVLIIQVRRVVVVDDQIHGKSLCLRAQRVFELAVREIELLFSVCHLHAES